MNRVQMISALGLAPRERDGISRATSYPKTS